MKMWYMHLVGKKLNMTELKRAMYFAKQVERADKKWEKEKCLSKK